MEWFRMHPYTCALAIAGTLLLGGTIVVNERTSPAPPSGQVVAWGGLGSVFNPAALPNISGTNNLSIMQQVQSAAPYTYIPVAAPQPQNTSPTNSDGFDFDAFISMLSQGSSGKAGGTSISTSGGAYSFIPSGLISTNLSKKTKTPLQESLYAYGNTTGSLILAFEAAHPNVSRIVMDQAQDRSDAGKKAAVEALGEALAALGTSLKSVSNVPEPFISAHASLSNSYIEIGTQLVLVPRAQTDAAFLAAIEKYNAAADAFTKNYVALANLFVAYDVNFSPSDTGSVFTFTQAPTF